MILLLLTATKDEVFEGKSGTHTSLANIEDTSARP